jgi:hypothetical protein
VLKKWVKAREYESTQEPLIYYQKSTGEYFRLRCILSSNKPVKFSLRTQKLIPPPLTEKELDSQDKACISVINLYQLPTHPKLPSLQTRVLQELSNTHIGKTISSLPIKFEGQFYSCQGTNQLTWYIQTGKENRVIGGPFTPVRSGEIRLGDFQKDQTISIADSNPIPIVLNPISGEVKEVPNKVISEYIKPRYEDWVEAGGKLLQRLHLIQPFWIDLWSEEAQAIFRNPSSDTHPKLKLKQAWEKQFIWNLGI